MSARSTLTELPPCRSCQSPPVLRSIEAAGVLDYPEPPILPGKDNIETAGRLDTRLVLESDHILECGIRQALPLTFGDRRIGIFDPAPFHLDKDKHIVQLDDKIELALAGAQSPGKDNATNRLIMSGSLFLGSDSALPVRSSAMSPARRNGREWQGNRMFRAYSLLIHCTLP